MVAHVKPLHEKKMRMDNHQPKGVAKTSSADEAMRKAARSHARMIISGLASIAENGKNETARVSAMKELLDRGFGKNHLMVQQEAPAGTEIQVVFGEVKPSKVVDGIIES